MRRITVEWRWIFLQVNVVHERQLNCTCTVGISLLACGFSVKLGPCLPAGQIGAMSASVVTSMLHVYENLLF